MVERQSFALSRDVNFSATTTTRHNSLAAGCGSGSSVAP